MAFCRTRNSKGNEVSSGVDKVGSLAQIFLKNL
jgi:hypothetical protein